MATDIIRRPVRPSPWRNPAIRGIVFQVLFVAAVLALGAFLVHNTTVNLRRQNIATGFGFLEREAAFGIGESLIAYSPADTYARAFLVGLSNTLCVSAIGVVLATILGTVVGLAGLSRNWPVAKLPGVFVSNRGILLPVPREDPAYWWMAVAFAIALAIGYAVFRWARRRQAETGRQFPAGWVGFGLAIGLPLAVFAVHGAPLELEWPVLRGFNFTGGTAFSPEFGALLIGLVIYTGSFIAEIVRA